MRAHAVVRYFVHLFIDKHLRRLSKSEKENALTRIQVEDSPPFYLFETNPHFIKMKEQLSALGFPAETSKRLVSTRLQNAIKPMNAISKRNIFKFNYAEELEKLLKAGVSPNARPEIFFYEIGSSFNSFLELADYYDNEDAAHLLFKFGADPTTLLNSKTDNRKGKVFEAAQAFSKALESEQACVEWENRQIVRELGNDPTLVKQYGGLSAHDTLPDSKTQKIDSPKRNHFPMHFHHREVKENFVIDTQQIPFFGETVFTHLTKHIADSKFGSGFPRYAISYAGTMAMPGAFQPKDLKDKKDSHNNKDEKNKISTALAVNHHVIELNNEHGKGVKLGMVWNDFFTHKSEVIKQVALCRDGHGHMPLLKTQSGEMKAVTAIEVPEESMTANPDLWKRTLDQNVMHVLFLKYNAKPERRVLQTPSYQPEPQYRSTFATKSASMQAMYVTGPKVSFKYETAELDYLPIFGTFEHHSIKPIVVNIGRLTDQEKLDYDRDSYVKKYRDQMTRTSAALHSTLKTKSRISPNAFLSVYPTYPDLQFLQGEIYPLAGRFFYKSETYEGMVYLTTDKDADAKRVVDAINNKLWFTAAFNENDSSEVILDPTPLYEFARARVAYSECMRVMNRSIQQHLNMPTVDFISKMRVCGLLLLRTHGINDIPMTISVLSGQNDLLGSAIFKLGICSEAADNLVAAINAKSPNAAKRVVLAANNDEQGVAISGDYLSFLASSVAYENLTKQVLSDLFTKNEKRERDFIDAELSKVGLVDLTLKKCAEHLTVVFGIEQAAESFVAVVAKLSNAISLDDTKISDEKVSIPDAKRIVDLTRDIRSEITNYYKKLGFFNYRDNTVELPETFENETRVKLETIEKTVATIEKRFRIK